MKNIVCIAFLGLTFFLNAQSVDYNTSKGYIAGGYDVTEYFSEKAVKGKSEYTTTYDGVKFKFASKDNLDKFLENPECFVPEYGGYCAYAIGAKNDKVGINPKTFEIREKKLYLFYNSFGINTLSKWKEEGAQELKALADTHWETLKHKK